MADLKKVIKALECCTTMGKDGFPMCEGCPYDTDGTCPELDTMHRDALEFLRAKEPVTPIEREGFYYCGECKYAFTVHGQKYCSNCGKMVKWDE